MRGHKRTDNSSGRDGKDTAFENHRTRIHKNTHAEKKGTSEEHLHNEPTSEDEDIGGVKSWTSTGPYLCLPEEGKMTSEQSWPLCAELALQADKDKNGSIRDQINQDLVFASLFSGVVAAFALESSKLLRVDQGEVAALILLRIHHQLDTLIRQNASAPLPALIPEEKQVFKLPEYAVAVNSLWLLSLTLSLGTAMLGIVCLIFLRTHEDETRAAAKEVVRRLYIQKERRRKMGVSSWHRMLRPMLLLALALFTIGLLIFDSKINEQVGLIYNVSIAVSLVAITCAGPVHARFQSRNRHLALLEENKAALGLVWVAQKFPQAIRAIYAFLQSTQEITPDLGRALLHELYHPTMTKHLHLSVYVDADLTARCSDELHRDIFVAYVLDRFAVDSSKESGLQAALVGHRFELLLRILNGADAYTPSGETPSRHINPPIGLGEAQIRNFTFAFFSNGDSVVRNISSECRIQYCEMVWKYMRNFCVQRISFLLNQHPNAQICNAVFLKLLVPSLSKASPWNMDSDVLQHVCALNRRMAQYVAPSSFLAFDHVLRERVAKAIIYVTQIFDIISPRYKEASQAGLAYNAERYKTTHPQYMNSITSLVHSIMTSKIPIEALDDLLETSEQDGWKEIVKIYRNQGSLELDEKGRAGGDAVIDMVDDAATLSF